jgi:hypothetical protein
MVIGEYMSQEFLEQNYLIIEQNVVTNCVLWNGDTNKWTPPQGSIALVQSIIPARVWDLDTTLTPPAYVLVEQLGQGQIGFTWDGTVLTTNEPQPIPPTPKEDQPETNGTVTI